MEKILNPSTNPKKKPTQEACQKFEGQYGKDLPFNCHMSFLGRTKSGKSVACRAMFEKYYKKYFNKGHCYIIAPTAEFEPWGELFPSHFYPENIISSCSENSILKVLRKIKDNFENGDGEFQPYTIQSLLILDDLANGIHGMHGFTSELMRARHYGCSIFICSQSALFLNPAQREACWCSSISPDFMGKKDLEKICFGKNIEPYRTKNSPADIPTLAECFKKVEEINRKTNNRYGRLFFSQCSGERKFYYQNAAELSPLFPNGIDVQEPKPKSKKPSASGSSETFELEEDL